MLWQEQESMVDSAQEDSDLAEERTEAWQEVYISERAL